MDNTQKQKAAELRRRGLGFAEIARRLHLSRDTVKSFCYRNKIAVESSENTNRCRECGKPLVQVNGRKKRVFCCSECRIRWWHKHPELINQKAVYTFVCAGCGKRFKAYGNNHRKYCSHSCYINSRFKGGDGNG